MAKPERLILSGAISIESNFQRYFGKLSVGVVLLDSDYKTCNFNSEFRELVGNEEPAGISFVSFLAEEVRAAATERFADVLHGSGGGMPVVRAV